MDRTYRIFVMTLGSTSTKVAGFENETILFSTNVTHEAAKLKEFKEISDQLPYRKETILRELARQNYLLPVVDAFVSAGGGLVGPVGGTYRVNSILLDDASDGNVTRMPRPYSCCAIAVEAFGGTISFQHDLQCLVNYLGIEFRAAHYPSYLLEV